MAATVSTFHMANGLVVTTLLVVLALMARLPLRIVLVYAIGATLLVVLYLHGYRFVDHGRPGGAFLHPAALGLYVAMYLGSILGGDGPAAAAFGSLGLVAAVAAGLRCLVARTASSTALATDRP